MEIPQNHQRHGVSRARLTRTLHSPSPRRTPFVPGSKVLTQRHGSDSYWHRRVTLKKVNSNHPKTQQHTKITSQACWKRTATNVHDVKGMKCCKVPREGDASENTSWIQGTPATLTSSGAFVSVSWPNKSSGQESHFFIVFTINNIPAVPFFGLFQNFYSKSS